MPVVALTCAKSSGVTVSALALALASPRRTLLAECDPAGGSIRAGFLGGWHTTAALGLHQLAAAERSGVLGAEFEQHLVALDGGRGERLLLPGLTDPAQASALAGTWPQLARLWPVWESEGYDVLVDAGRAVVESGTELNTARYPAALLRAADVVLLVLRPSLTSVAAARPVVATLRADLAQHGTGADALGLLLIEEDQGSRKLPGSEIAGRLGAPVMGLLPWDPTTAFSLTHGPTGRGISDRSPLLRAARTACEQLAAVANRRRVQLYAPAERQASDHV